MMDTIFKTDNLGRERMFDIVVERLSDGTANIVKTCGLVTGHKFVTTTHVPLGVESANKRAATIWKNEKYQGILPMLAHKWDEKKKFIKEPFFAQPKLDGVRIIVSKDGGISRTGKVVKGTEHWGKHLGVGEYLDGECYTHGMSFESITSAFKTKPETLTFHVFDYYDMNRPQLPFSQRMKYTTVKTVKVDHKKDILKVHKDFVDEGYEGIMVRNAESEYEPGKRSNNLLKLKNFETEEFKIIGVHEGSGRDKGTPVWECETETGEIFSVRPEGSLEMRKDAFNNSKKTIKDGKMLTVRYQNLTSGNVPRFPIGVAIRDYE
jgi:ATP-dependent DNA ligase